MLNQTNNQIPGENRSSVIEVDIKNAYDASEYANLENYLSKLPGLQGIHLDRQEVKKGFHTACRLAGIEGLIWKDLKATFGTRLAEAGCDAFTIAQLLGHSDVRVTMRYVGQLKRASVRLLTPCS